MAGGAGPLDLAAFAALRDRDLRAEGLVVAEGRLLAERLLAAPRLEVLGVLCVPALAGRFEELASGRCPVLVRPEAALAETAGYPFHRGVIAAARRPSLPGLGALLEGGAAAAGPARAGFSDAQGPARADQAGAEGRARAASQDGAAGPARGGLVGDAADASGPGAARARRRLLLLPATVDPENMGSLFRSAAALGADAVLLGPGSCDHLSRRALRVSMGAVLSLPAVLAPGPEALAELASAGYGLAGTVLDPAARDLADWHPPRRLCLLIGNEYEGLGPEWLPPFVERVTIPMEPGSDSLNAAAAAAIFMHRAFRG